MPAFIALISRCLCAPEVTVSNFRKSVDNARTFLRAWGCPYAKGKRNCMDGPDAVGFPG